MQPVLPDCGRFWEAGWQFFPLLESSWKAKTLGICVLELKVHCAGPETFVTQYEVKDFECFKDLEKLHSI